MVLRHKYDVASLWHKRLGHVAFGKLRNVLNVNCKPHFDMQCAICPQSNQSWLLFHESVTGRTLLFDLINANIWGLYKVPSMIGSRYFLTIVDDKSRVTWTYLLQRKYTLDLLSDAGLLGCKPSKVLMDTNHKVSLSDCELLADPLS